MTLDLFNQYDLTGLRCDADEIGHFYDKKRHWLVATRTARTVYLCQGKGGKKGWGLTHIDERGHFGGMLRTSEYGQELVAATIDHGQKGQYRGSSNTNYTQTFFCSAPDLSDFKFSFKVRVSVGADDNIITAFIDGNDYLDQMSPDRISQACQDGHYP